MIFVFHQFSNQSFLGIIVIWLGSATSLQFRSILKKPCKTLGYLIIMPTKVLAPCNNGKGYNRTGPKYQVKLLRAYLHSSVPRMLRFIHLCWNTVLPTSFIPLAYAISGTTKFYSQPDSYTKEVVGMDLWTTVSTSYCYLLHIWGVGWHAAACEIRNVAMITKCARYPCFLQTTHAHVNFENFLKNHLSTFSLSNLT